MPINPLPWSDVYNKLVPPLKLKKDLHAFIGVICVLAVAGLLSFFFDGGITGFVSSEPLQVLVLNSVFNESVSLELNISHAGSLMASGVVHNGLARVYYQDSNNSLSLVFDSELFFNASLPLSFSDACVDTCSLDMADLRLLVVLRGENASLSLSNISYSAIVPAGVIDVLPVADVSLDNSTVVNLSQFFVESFGHSLTYSAIVPEGVRGVLYGDVLFLSERDAGVFNLTIVASNGVVSAVNSFLVVAGGLNEIVVNETSNITVINETVNNSVDVDEKIVAEFLKRKKVPVIVLLKKNVQQDFSAKTADKKALLDAQKLEIDAVQDSVIDDLKEKNVKTDKVDDDLITGAQVADLVSGNVKAVKQYENINAIAVEITSAELELLLNNSNVSAIFYDFVLNVSLQDSVPLIRASDAHLLSSVVNETVTGHGQSVCVIDTGVDYTHPALAGKVVGGIDFVNGDADAMDDNGLSHGTHVAGIVSAVAPDARIVPVKICDAAGGCSASNILAGIDYCVNRSVELNISVISASLGDGGQYDSSNCPIWFDSALLTADSLGVINVYASGNNGYQNGVSYPSCSPFSLSVGAADKSDVVASFTNRGSRLDVLAPGVSINSTVRGGGYGLLSGTSMATPFVSGAVALLKQVAEAQQQSLSLNASRQLFRSSGVAVGSWKRVDVLDAVRNILAVVDVKNIVLLSNSFDGENWSVMFNVSGSDDLVIVPSNGTILREVPDDNLSLNDVEFVSLLNDAVVNVTFVDGLNNSLPYDVYLMKKRIEGIKKRLGELG